MPSERPPYSPLASIPFLVLVVCALAQFGCSERVLVGREPIIDAGVGSGPSADEDAAALPRPPDVAEGTVDQDEEDDDDDQDGGDDDDSDGDDDDDSDDDDDDDDGP